MRRMIAIALAAALLLLGGCGSGGTYRTPKQIQESGELRVAVNPTGQPFAWATSTGYQGSEVDFVEELARALGVKAVYGEYPETGVMDAVRYGDADIAIGRLSTSYASGGLSFTLELGQESACLLARQPARYDTVGSLEGRVVGLVEDSPASDVFRWGDETLQEWLVYPALDAAVSGLMEGDIVAVVCTEEEAAAVMELSAGQLTACGLINGERARYGAAVNSSNPELLRLANALLEAPYLEAEANREAGEDE